MISAVNLTKFVGNCGFGHTYRKKSFFANCKVTVQITEQLSRQTRIQNIVKHLR